jgi:O-antigen/teichoic acid export membrane protein
MTVQAAAAPQGIKERTVRSGAVTMGAQGIKFGVSTISTIVLARLVSPEDYGLYGMVNALLGVLHVVKNAGLLEATVQRDVLTHEELSAIFWLNTGLGVFLAAASAALAPAFVAFYREPRLFWITVVLGVTFLVGGVSTQHQALLRRQMRFGALAFVDVTAMAVGVTVGIAMARAGFGYWALVSMAAATAVTNACLVWIASPWWPGRPSRSLGVTSMVRFGSYLSGANLFNYLFRNADNVLIGWFWGPAPLGFYQKAYGLLSLPIEQINAPVGSVVISALCRLRGDPQRMRRYFLGGYTVVVSALMPIILSTAIFADDVILFLLGARWTASANVFRLLAPAALIGAALNPFGALFIATDQTDRQFKLAAAWSLLIVLAFAVGLRYGPTGVAAGYSLMSAALALPLCMYAIKGTAVRLSDLGTALKFPVLAGVIAGALGLIAKVISQGHFNAGVRAVGGCFIVAIVYAFVLLVVLRQWSYYRNVLGQLLARNSEN